MKFKDLRELIFTQCKVIVGKETSDFIQTHEVTKYDELEVIGVRSRPIMVNGICANTYVEVICK